MGKRGREGPVPWYDLLAALMRERTRYAGQKAGVVLSGGNIDAPALASALTGHTPQA